MAEQVRSIDNLNEKLIGYVSIYGDESGVGTTPPRHGIRRPSWFNPRDPTISDVNRIALQMRGRT